MCGIFSLVESNSSFNSNEIIDKVSRTLFHRGPDSKGYKIFNNDEESLLMVHTRLKLVGDDTTQPISNKEQTVFLTINGEIFNWKELQTELDYTCTKCDCEIIIPLYEKYKDDLKTLFLKLEGQFSFILYDTRNNYILVGRDRIGVTPLYIGTSTKNKRFAVASEMKCLIDLVDDISVFNPRQYLYESLENIFDKLTFHKYLKYENYQESKGFEYIDGDKDVITSQIREKLTNSVRSQLQDLVKGNNTEDFGVLLSGGLDSSLIASLIVKLAKEMGYTRKIKSFSIGVNSEVPDLVAARKAAKYLDTEHYEFHFSIKEGIDNLDNVIYHIESYDCTSVRASTPMYLLAYKIKQKFPQLKVLFSGELSDELLCYLYGANAPTEDLFQFETISLVNNVHLFDCLRANKTCMAHSIEVRVPFTDSKYVDYILQLHPKWKTFGKNKMSENNTPIMEKQILRDSFVGYLPNEILYRKKEQFSDGVSGFNGKENNWIDALKHYSEEKYNDNYFKISSCNYTYNRPDTKEKLLYREKFQNIFNNNKLNTSEFVVKTWEPKWSDSKDPSGRIQNFWSL